MDKVLTIAIIVFLIFLFGGIHVFNHYNAWLGILIVVIGFPFAYYVGKIVDKFSK